MHLLNGKIQHYAWGGTEFIPNLLSVSNHEKKPFAEYWMGTHPGGQARVRVNDQESVSLAELIKSDPLKYLGEEVDRTFRQLPYLLKVLDVKDMLSIQVHPAKKEAEAGFDRENEAGIALDAANRNYKDRNHKPEVMVALSDFWLLHGFSPVLPQILENSEWFGALFPVFETRGIKGLYQYVMELPQEGVDILLAPLAKTIVPLYDAGSLQKNSPDFWAGRVLAKSKPSFTNLDRGIFSIYFFNIVKLVKGEGIFQGAGVPHAYLEGQNIELMSNSDNVLRAGLTPKFIDVAELLRHTVFEYTEPKILYGIQREQTKIYPCPVPDFIMYQTSLKEGEIIELKSGGPEISILMNGTAEWYNEEILSLVRGQALFMGANETYKVKAISDCDWFTAGVPVDML